MLIKNRNMRLRPASSLGIIKDELTKVKEQFGDDGHPGSADSNEVERA